MDRNAGNSDARTACEFNHGGGPVIRSPAVEIIPPGQTLAIHDPGAVNGDIGQFGTVNKIRTDRKSAHGGHLQGGPSGKLKGHIAFKRHRTAEKISGRNNDCPSVSHRVDGGLDRGGVIGASRGGIIGSGSDGKCLG